MSERLSRLICRSWTQRKMACPPSCTIPASNATRVDVLGCWKKRPCDFSSQVAMWVVPPAAAFERAAYEHLSDFVARVIGIGEHASPLQAGADSKSAQGPQCLGHRVKSLAVPKRP